MATFKMYWATALTGGGTGALDAIDGDDLEDKYAGLVGVEGDKYYFVRTKEMEKRANTKVTKNKWNIKMVIIKQ